MAPLTTGQPLTEWSGPSNLPNCAWTPRVPTSLSGTLRAQNHPGATGPIGYESAPDTRRPRRAPTSPRETPAKHGSKPSKLKDLNGVRYCLILHNRQFLYVPDWEKIAIPDLSAFDAVLALHQESFPPAQTWQVLRNGFGKPVRSQNVNDLGDIAAFRNSNRAHRIDAELVKSAWQQIEALGLTDDDIRAAITEARAKNSHR